MRDASRPRITKNGVPSPEAARLIASPCCATPHVPPEPTVARLPLCSQTPTPRAAARVPPFAGAVAVVLTLTACDLNKPDADPSGPTVTTPDTDAGPDAPTEVTPPATTDTPGDAAETDTAPPQATSCDGCDDGDACNGAETCDEQGNCLSASPILCDIDATCVTQQGAATCVPWCGLPTGPNVAVVAGADALTFVASRTVETALLDVGASTATAIWSPTATVTPPAAEGTWRVLARAVDSTCADDGVFDLLYTWSARFAGPAGSPTGRAWAYDDAAFVGWATAVVDQTLGADVASVWLDPSRALGAAGTSTTDITALGEGGTLTLTFASAISDGPGDDFAVFENGFADDFLELAEVEVSSDGVTFARFDTATHVPDAIGAYGTLDPRALHGFAGTVRVGFGVGFDLARLTFSPAVVAGLVDLAAISQVRLLDVPGDGRRADAWGRPVYDPWPTVGSAGFDLDAIGVLHQAAP